MRQYCILQSRLSFAWGTDISHLRATTLVPKPVNTASYVNGQASNNIPQQRKFSGSKKAAGQSQDNFNSQYNWCQDFNHGNKADPAIPDVSQAHLFIAGPATMWTSRSQTTLLHPSFHNIESKDINTQVYSAEMMQWILRINATSWLHGHLSQWKSCNHSYEIAE